MGERVLIPLAYSGLDPSEVDLQASRAAKDGVKLKFVGQPFQVLTILLEPPAK